MAAIIVDSARLMAEAMPLLRNVAANGARLHELTERLVRMEGHADEIHAAGLKQRVPARIGDERCDAVHRRSARSTSISSASSTPSRTSPTRSTASSSITPDGADHARTRPAAAGRPDRRRAGVRLPQRPARRRQFDRHGGRDPAARARSRRCCSPPSSISRPIS